MEYMGAARNDASRTSGNVGTWDSVSVYDNLRYGRTITGYCNHVREDIWSYK